jgi:hypothetical protein
VSTCPLNFGWFTIQSYHQLATIGFQHRSAVPVLDAATSVRLVEHDAIAAKKVVSPDRRAPCRIHCSAFLTQLLAPRYSSVGFCTGLREDEILGRLVGTSALFPSIQECVFSFPTT